VEVVEAAVVDTVGVEVTAAMEATATVEVVMEVEPADTAVAEEVTVEGLPHVVPLHRTIAEVEVAAAVVDDPEGTIVLVQDHTLLVSILIVLSLISYLILSKLTTSSEQQIIKSTCLQQPPLGSQLEIVLLK